MAKLTGWLSGWASGGTRRQRGARSATAGWAFSALWHLLALAVLALQVHPFQIPQTTPTVTVELLPPLPPPEPPVERIEPPLQRIEPAAKPAPPPVQPAPAPPKPIHLQKPAPPVTARPALTKPLVVPPPPILTPPAPAPAPPVPTETPRPFKPVIIKPAEIQRPPGPVAPSPSLAKPLEVQAPPTLAPAPAPVAAPAPPRPVSIPSQSQVVAPRAAPLPVLTNDQTAIGPIEIKPPDRPQKPEQTGAAAAGGGGAAGGGAPAGGGGGGGGGGNAAAYDGPIAGFDQKGLHTSLGCLNQDTYHLSAADRAACLQRTARETRGADDLGPNTPPDKKAEYDHKVACHDAYVGAPMPSLADASTGGTSVSGLGNVPSLTDCSPADR